MSSSLTNALEESTKNNEQLQREINALKTDNTELKAINNTMKDKIKQLTAKFDKTVEQLNSQSSKIETIKDENKQLKTKLHQLKVSQWRDHVRLLLTILTMHLIYNALSHCPNNTQPVGFLLLLYK